MYDQIDSIFSRNPAGYGKKGLCQLSAKKVFHLQLLKKVSQLPNFPSRYIFQNGLEDHNIEQTMFKLFTWRAHHMGQVLYLHVLHMPDKIN